MPVRLTIKDMQSIAKTHGGKCLSKEYVSATSLLTWKCSEGHTWNSAYAIIKYGGWCNQCAIKEQRAEKLKQKTFDRLKSIAVKKGGECISEEFVSISSKLKWKCGKGHVWLMQGNTLRNGQWCKECKRNEKCKKELKIIQRLAKQKGGICLSEKYKTNDTKLKFKCSQGHTFFTYPQSIKKGFWCRICSDNKNHQNLRLSLLDLQKHANKQGGELLSVKYIRSQELLRWKCKEGHMWKASAASVFGRNSWCKICNHSGTKRSIKEFQEIAKGKGGKLLSKEYINIKTYMKWQCTVGHTWLAPAQSIVQGVWCNECKKPSIDELKKIAKNNGGKLLSKAYINYREPLQWQCKKGHKWDATSHSIKEGSWCKQCYLEGKKGTIEQFQDIAKNHGGKLLSKKYIDSYTRLKWQCDKGHVWLTTPQVISRGGWCRRCNAENQKLTIDVFDKIAKGHGGKLISRKYVDTTTPLKWQCSKGHIWVTKPATVRQGHWCPVCAKEK